jgi:hypothetical protein
MNTLVEPGRPPGPPSAVIDGVHDRSGTRGAGRTVGRPVAPIAMKGAGCGRFFWTRGEAPAVLRIDPNLLQGAIAVVVLFGVIGLGIWIITHLRREMIETPDDPEEMWSQIEEAYEAGEIDVEEYQRVRAALAKKGQHQGIGGLKRPPDVAPRSHRPVPEARPETKAPEGLAPSAPSDPGEPGPPTGEGH